MAGPCAAILILESKHLTLGVQDNSAHLSRSQGLAFPSGASPLCAVQHPKSLLSLGHCDSEAATMSSGCSDGVS